MSVPRSVAGHQAACHEEVIRDNLHLGRPDQVQLIFARRVSKRTPGRFRTRVITEGVTPSLHFDYKHARIKQYYKEGRDCSCPFCTRGAVEDAVGSVRRIGAAARRSDS